MCYQPSAAIFESDAPLNSMPLIASQPRSLRKMATGTPLIYGPFLLLLLAACANGNDGPSVAARPKDIDQTPEEAGYRNTLTGTDGDDTIYARSVYLFLGIIDEYLGSTYGYLLVDAEDERFDEGGEFGPQDNVALIESVTLSDHDDQVATDGNAKEFDGGAGTDTLVFANSIEPVTINLSNGVDADSYFVMAPSSETDPRYDSY